MHTSGAHCRKSCARCQNCARLAPSVSLFSNTAHRNAGRMAKKKGEKKSLLEKTKEIWKATKTQENFARTQGTLCAKFKFPHCQDMDIVLFAANLSK